MTKFREYAPVILGFGFVLLIGGTLALAQEVPNQGRHANLTFFARPEGQREMGIKRAASIATSSKIPVSFRARGSGGSMEYKETIRSAYNRAVPLEVYQSGSAQYEVSALNDQVVHFGARPIRDVQEEPVEIDFTVRFGQAELATQAREFAMKYGSTVDFDALVPHVDDKEGLVYFFRWEDISRDLESGLHPFMQVGITVAGEVVNYTNTLEFPLTEGTDGTPASDLASVSVSQLKSQAAVLAGPAGLYLFANNGPSWGESGTWYTQNGEGYCGHIKSCPGNAPTSMRYTYETDMWSRTTQSVWWNHPYSAVLAQHFVFIPRVHATTRWATYEVGTTSSGGNFSLDQLIHSDEFVYTGTFRAISWTRLLSSIWGGQRATGRQIGADEIKIQY